MSSKIKNIFYLFFPIIVGGIVGFIISGNIDYNSLVKPPFAPPKILFPIVWSIIYLLVFSSRYAYCGKRILFNKRVCKKCYNNSHAIVENFDEKIDMFYEQMSVYDNITDIITSYAYVINQFVGINDIYEALDEEVDTESMEQKTLVTLHRTLEEWIKNHIFQFKANEAYRLETIQEIKDLQEDQAYFKDILQPYLEEIEEISNETTESTPQL